MVGSSAEVTFLVRSKRRTYEALSGVVHTPELFDVNGPIDFPVFVKPDIGQGSNGAFLAHTESDLLRSVPGDLVCTYLPGEEYTVDCLSNKAGELLYVSPRNRSRVRQGIAVASTIMTDNGEFIEFARKILNHLKLSGGWFFQVKRDHMGRLCLLEVAARISGSMGLSRARGVNFVELSLLVQQGLDIRPLRQEFAVSMDRAFDRKITTDVNYQCLYTDFDDCIFLDKKN